MAVIGYDPQFLQQTAQAQLQAALRHHSAAWKSPEPNPNNMPASSHSPEPPFPAGDPSLHGYTRIPLSSPPPNRTLSAPIPPPPNSALSARMPEEFNFAPAHSIHRPCSAPIPETDLPVPASTPPRPPVASTSRDRCGSSPVAKRAKRMQEKIIEMNKLWDEVLKEAEEDAASLNAHPCPHKEECERIMQRSSVDGEERGYSDSALQQALSDADFWK